MRVQIGERYDWHSESRAPWRDMPDRDGLTVTVIRSHGDEEDGMWVVRFEDGYEVEVWEEELTPTD